MGLSKKKISIFSIKGRASFRFPLKSGRSPMILEDTWGVGTGAVSIVLGSGGGGGGGVGSRLGSSPLSEWNGTSSSVVGSSFGLEGPEIGGVSFRASVGVVPTKVSLRLLVG